MKNLVILIVFLLPLCSQAQTSGNSPWLEKGEIQVGVGFGPNFGGYGGTSTRTAPYIQYFIRDRWSVRLEGQHESGGFKQERHRFLRVEQPQYLGAGLSTQYYFLKKDRLSIYGQAGYSMGRYSVYIPGFYDFTRPRERNLMSNFNRFSLGVGAQYRMSDRWILNALAERLETTRFTGGSTSVSIGVGFRSSGKCSAVVRRFPKGDSVLQIVGSL
jgi:opacity protein-like surface antigen